MGGLNVSVDAVDDVTNDLEKAVAAVEAAFPGAREMTIGEAAAAGRTLIVDCRACGRVVEMPAARLSSVHPASPVSRAGGVLRCRECRARQVGVGLKAEGGK